jgi:predicted Zn-dependent protease
MKPILGILAGALLLAGGCATNPVTGKKELSFVGEDWELQTGAQHYSPSRQSQGGDYNADPRVERYINSVGQKLAAVSDRKLPYEFKVLNSGVPNAWALPGGKIAINRGLLLEMQSEAELAAVLGHEIVHAAARHGAQGMTRGVLLQGGVMAATVASSGRRLGNLAQLGAGVTAQLLNQRYGRDAERESDRFGITYMARAGYDPQGAVDLQQTFLNLSKGQRRQDFISGLFASHPPSAERLATNRKIAASLPKGGEVGRDRYQANISSLIRAKPAYDDYEKAKKAFAEKDLTSARSLVRKAIAREPREGHFHSLLGDVESASNNLTRARKHYADAISRNADFFYYHLRSGLVSERVKDYASARRSLQRSIELLPTGDAHAALGDIAMATGRRADAIKAYQTASQDSGPAGQRAMGALVDLDLPANPGKYLVARTQVTERGQLRVQLQNRTPRNLGNISLQLIYPDSRGRMQQVTRGLDGTVEAGKSQVIEVPVIVNPKLAQNVRASVVRASVIR